MSEITNTREDNPPARERAGRRKRAEGKEGVARQKQKQNKCCSETGGGIRAGRYIQFVIQRDVSGYLRPFPLSLLVSAQAADALQASASSPWRVADKKQTRDLVSGPRCWSRTPVIGDPSGLATDYPPLEEVLGPGCTGVR